jgi:hypothetical protein
LFQLADPCPDGQRRTRPVVRNESTSAGPFARGTGRCCSSDPMDARRGFVNSNVRSNLATWSPTIERPAGRAAAARSAVLQRHHAEQRVRLRSRGTSLRAGGRDGSLLEGFQHRCLDLLQHVCKAVRAPATGPQNERVHKSRSDPATRPDLGQQGVPTTCPRRV